MPTSYRVLGQATAATTAVSLYTVPASTTAVISTVSVCNFGTATTYRIAVRPLGAAIANQHYLTYDSSIPANDSVLLTLGLTLSATDVVSVSSGMTATATNLSFGLFGSEIT